MAIIFELMIECETQEQAEQQVRHFDGYTFTLQNGLDVLWKAGIEQTYSGTWAVEIWSSQLSNSGVRTVEDAIEMSECGICLFHHLLSAPDFLLAYVAFNPCIYAVEIEDFLIPLSDGSRHCSFSCVFSHELKEHLGPLRYVRPFRSNYVWWEYQGENYWPLGSFDNQHLLQLKKRLLPV